jgi:NADPH:quinone reductase-like Zn-dependent oxidoreductase
MKAARIHEYGHSDRIQIEDVAMPTATSTEVLVRIDAAGINPVDWKIREGLVRFAKRALPFTLGQDFAGQVIAVGEDVTEIVADEEVYGFASGAYAEYAVVSPDAIASKPRTIHDIAAAGLPTPGLTALQLVRDHVAPRRGQVVLIQGAAGGVGSIVTQLCVAADAHVIATASARDREYLIGLGVAEVIDYKSERFEDRVHGADAVIDLVGGETLERSLDVVQRGGIVATIVGKPDEARARSRGIRAVQMWMKRDANDLRELARLVDDGIVTPRGTHVVPLDHAREAQDLNQFGRTSEKVVLEVH